ncbi:lipocalin [Sinisalibacter lacisalsi]|uniref:Lipocalin n=1 Tax=Sinisalibacter lacisalsi TaxID=1526570 RepID=A0ABQ1QRW7_9RHOB|nr:lipocalin [Sinisalibacter lacisalsi]GGD43091.1 lipocalin [Sinisalibacter lacisalsi]
MRRLILAAALALAGCGDAGAPRDTSARMTSIVGFDPARFAGEWREVAAIGRPPGALWRVEAGPGGALAVSTSRDGAGRGEMVGPGRFRLSQFAAPLWVLWADADMRTLVLGTPDGRFAMVLDRAARPAPDRLQAARDVLEWNGYDLGALRG